MASYEQSVRILKQGNADQRKRALSWLAKSGDERALKALAWAAKNDEDAALREYAKKGHRYLKQLLEQEPDDFADASSSGWSGSEADDSGYSYDDDSYDYDDEDDGYGESFDDGDDGYGDNAPSSDAPAWVDAIGRDSSSSIDFMAKRSIGKAVTAHLDGQPDRAITHLLEAFDIDHHAVNDSGAQGVASEITGLPPDKAIRALGDPAYVAEIVRGGNKRKRTSSADDPSWGTAGMDIGIFTLVNMGGLAALGLLGVNRFLPLLTSLQSDREFQQALAESDLKEFYPMFLDFLQSSTSIIILGALGYALYLAFITVVQNMAIHFAAVMFFDGRKPSAVTMDKLINVQSIYYGLTYVVTIGLLFAIPNNLNVYIGESSIGGGSIAMFIFAGLFFVIGSIVFSIAQIMAVSRAQEFSFWSGCLSQIVGGIMLGVVNFVFSLVMQILGAVVSAGVILPYLR